MARSSVPDPAADSMASQEGTGMINNAEYVIWVKIPDPEDPEEGWTLEELQDHRQEIEDYLNKMPNLIQYDFRGVAVDG